MAYNEQLESVIKDVLYSEWRCDSDECLATDLTKAIGYYFELTPRDVS